MTHYVEGRSEGLGPPQTVWGARTRPPPGRLAGPRLGQRGVAGQSGSTIAPGGVLLYATCSIFRVEGQQQIDAFLQRHAVQGARLAATAPGHLLPLPDNEPDRFATTPVVGDGFFYALIRKP